MSKASQFFDSLTLSVASGLSVRDAASIAKCSASQAYRMCREPEFRQRVSEIRSESTVQAVGRLTLAANKAVDTLVSLLDASNEPSVRMNASKAILASLAPLSEFGELRQRIDALENMKLKVA